MPTTAPATPNRQAVLDAIISHYAARWADQHHSTIEAALASLAPANSSHAFDADQVARGQALLADYDLVNSSPTPSHLPDMATIDACVHGAQGELAIVAWGQGTIVAFGLRPKH